MSHVCHALKCADPCPPKHLMCRRHWRIVPLTLKRAVMRSFQPGQEDGKLRPSGWWFASARAAIRAVAVKEGHFQQKLVWSDEPVEDRPLVPEPEES